LPKSKGGLGLRNPELLNNVLVSKTWWRWIQDKGELWSKLWEHKYAPLTFTCYRMLMFGNILGSLIWNATWKNISSNIIYFGKSVMGSILFFGNIFGSNFPFLSTTPSSYFLFSPISRMLKEVYFITNSMENTFPQSDVFGTSF
jgi:hypothetical protein